MTPDLSKFEEKHKKSLLETIGSTLWLGLEDLMHTIGIGKKPGNKEERKSFKKNQIPLELDKYENAKIAKSK